MKIVLDPMATLRQEAENKIDGVFNVVASCNAQRDVEYAEKRKAAAALLDGTPCASLEAEAAALNMTPADLAKIILAKPNEVLERGLKRRQAIIAVRKAATPAELAQVVDNLPN